MLAAPVSVASLPPGGSEWSAVMGVAVGVAEGDSAAIAGDEPPTSMASMVQATVGIPLLGVECGVRDNNGGVRRSTSKLRSANGRTAQDTETEITRPRADPARRVQPGLNLEVASRERCCTTFRCLACVIRVLAERCSVSLPSIPRW